MYSALSAFSKILYSQHQILDRSSADSLVLQRHKSQVVRCLDHRDPSIRRRALDVVAGLVDETNVESLIPEVMSYIKMADGDFRTEMIAKVFAAVQRFAPTPIWNFNIVLKLVEDSGNYVGNDVITEFCKLIANNIEIRPHAIQSLQGALYSDSNNQTLVQVSAWALGEFQEDQSDTIEVLKKLSKLPQTSSDTRCYIITALAKLSVRFNQVESVKDVFNELSKNNDPEVQQRAGEMLRIVSNPSISEQILAPMEFVNEQKENAVSQPIVQPQQKEDNLLDFDYQSSPTPQTQNQTKSTDNSLIDSLASDFQLKQQNAQQPQQQNVPKINPPPGAIEVLRTNDYVIYFEIQRNANNQSQVAIRSSVFNLTQKAFPNFIVQFGVPQGWAIMAQPPSGNSLPPIGEAPIRQVLMLENRGVNQLMMKPQISYLYGTQPIKEMGTIPPEIFK